MTYLSIVADLIGVASGGYCIWLAIQAYINKPDDPDDDNKKDEKSDS